MPSVAEWVALLAAVGSLLVSVTTALLNLRRYPHEVKRSSAETGAVVVKSAGDFTQHVMSELERLEEALEKKTQEITVLKEDFGKLELRYDEMQREMRRSKQQYEILRQLTARLVRSLAQNIALRKIQFEANNGNCAPCRDADQALARSVEDILNEARCHGIELDATLGEQNGPADAK